MNFEEEKQVSEDFFATQGDDISTVPCRHSALDNAIKEDMMVELIDKDEEEDMLALKEEAMSIKRKKTDSSGKDEVFIPSTISDQTMHNLKFSHPVEKRENIGSFLSQDSETQGDKGLRMYDYQEADDFHHTSSQGNLKIRAALDRSQEHILPSITEEHRQTPRGGIDKFLQSTLERISSTELLGCKMNTERCYLDSSLSRTDLSDTFHNIDSGLENSGRKQEHEECLKSNVQKARDLCPNEELLDTFRI